MGELADFILARVDEEEAALVRRVHEAGLPSDEALEQPWARRGVRECAARRNLVELHLDSHDCPYLEGVSVPWDDDIGDDDEDPECATLVLVAYPYYEHPDLPARFRAPAGRDAP